MSLLSRLVFGALLATAVTGCGRYYEFGHANTGGRGRGEFAFLAPTPRYSFGLVSTAPEREPETVYVNNVYYVNGPPPGAQPRPLQERPQAEELPSFDPQAARGALNAIDVSGCQVAGAKTGYGHAKVTMNPDGRVSKVVVDEPAGLSTEAAKCIGDRIGTVTVPPFKGSFVTVGTTYHVK